MEINTQSIYYEVLLSYNINWPMEPNTWDGKAHPISIFGTIEFIKIDAKNIYTSLLCMADFIRSRKINTGVINNVKELKGFGDAAFNFVSYIYKANWNIIYADNHNNSSKNRIVNKFTPKVKKPTMLSKVRSSKDKQVEIVRIPSPILACSPKEILEKSKFFDRKDKNPMNINKAPQKLLYTQVAGLSILDILKLKDNFPNLLAKKIKNI